MKNLLTRISSLCFAMVAGFLFFACGPQTEGPEEQKGDFSVKVHAVGADFVELEVTAPAEVEMAYVIDKEPLALSPAVLFATGTTTRVSPGAIIKVKDGIVQETSYYLYAVAKLDAQNYSKVIELEFETEAYEFTDLVNVVETYLDGFKVHIAVPKETKERGNVIRYGSTSLAWYNLLKNSKGGDAVDVNAVVANGNPYGNYVKNDSTIVVNDDNVVLMGPDGEPVIDADGQQIDLHDPISPGEPTIFLAGECRWGSPEEYAAIMGFHLPEDYSYSIPLFSWNGGWTGAFQKVEFFTKEPTVCDCTVNIDIPEDEITVTDAMIYFDADDEVARYFYMVLDNATYNQVLATYLDGHEEWYQWFLTSYIAFYEWGVYPETSDTYINAAANFVEPLTGGETYHVLVTVMGDNDGSSQRFIHKTFTAKEKTKLPPVIEVTAVQNNDPYVATFNIKAPGKDVVGSYWACNYAREFEVMFNAKYTYADLLKGNYTFSSEEINLINSDEGYTVSFPTLDGEVTRFAAYGCNDEYTFNNISRDVEGQGWADYKAPMAEKAAPVSSPLFAALEGDWTATATIIAKEQIDDETVVSHNVKHSSKITISNTAPYVPEVLDESVYANYSKNTKDDVDGMFEELHILSDQFAEYRLEGQNRMLCTGFLDFDYFKNPGRMDTRTPYDLFVAKDYGSVDVPQIMYDFGPKWFLEVLEDGSVIVPFNSTYLPPMHNWPMYAKYDWDACTYYVGGVGSGIGFYDPNESVHGFPVEVSEDMNTITIKPIVLSDGNEQQVFYMNAMGVNPQDPSSLDIVATVISEIVLTRGWNETKSVKAVPAAVPSKVKAVTMDGAPVTKAPAARRYKSMTKLEVEPAHEYKYDETPNVVTMDMVEKTSAKILKHFNVQ